MIDLERASGEATDRAGLDTRVGEETAMGDLAKETAGEARETVGLETEMAG